MRLHKLYEKKRPRPDHGQMDRAKQRFGFTEQPGSGSGRWKKSDLFDETHQVEGKATDKKSIRISGGILTKLTREANAVGKVPALLVSVRLPYRSCAHVSQDWIAVPAEFYEKLLVAWSKLQTS